MSELIRKFAPIGRTDIYDDRRHLRLIAVQPDRRRTLAVVFDMDLLGLPIRQKPDSRQVN